MRNYLEVLLIWFCFLSVTFLLISLVVLGIMTLRLWALPVILLVVIPPYFVARG